MRAAVLITLVFCAGPSAADPGPALGPAAVAGRTPAPGTWRGAPFPLSDYFTPGELRRWRAHRDRHRRVNLVAVGLDLLTYVLLLTWPGRRLFRAAGRLARRVSRSAAGRSPPGAVADRLLTRGVGADWGAALLFAYATFAIGVTLDLPLSLWHEVISRQAGLSTYTAGAWISDWAKALAVSCILFSMLVIGLYGLIRRFPRGWWLVLSLPVALAFVGLGLISPYGTRVFNEVTPLAQHPYPDRDALTRRLTELARSRGVSLDQIKVVDSSRRSRVMNAYLTGLGPSRELVLFDTLLEEATPAEVASVVAHELGHVDRRREVMTYGLGALGLIALLGLLSLVMRLGARRLGLEGPGDIRTLPIIGLTAMLLFNLLLPLQNWRSRAEELRADRFALTLTGDPDAFISMEVKLARRNRADVDPSPWVELWLFSHPPVVERIGQARWYRSWLSSRPRTGNNR